MLPFTDSTGLLRNSTALRARLAQDGYLLLRGVAPRRELVSLHLQLLDIVRPHGWVCPTSAPGQARVNPGAACADPDPSFARVYRLLFRVEALHELAHHPALLALLESLLGSAVLIHPRVVVRAIFPNHPPATTPAHQDHQTLRGTPDTYTVWIPLTDCPPEFGGLRIAAGSNRDGLLETRVGEGIGGVELASRPKDGWVEGHLGLGDLLIFHSLTVHEAARNLTDRLRLSVDIRYQRLSDPVHPGCFALTDGRSWAETYAGWKSVRLQYFWRRLDLNLQPPLAMLRRLAERDGHPLAAWAGSVLAAFGSDGPTVPGVEG